MTHVDNIVVKQHLGNKIAIIGSPGAGKTTLALQLREILEIPVFHLERYFWMPDWKKKPGDNRIKILKGIIYHEQWWIIEGTYLRSSGPRLEEADTIIFLDIPPWLCLLHVICRRFKERQIRFDLPDGCSSNLRLRYILKVLFFRIRHHQELSQKMHSYELDKNVIWLRSPKEVENFLVQFHEQRDAKESYNGQVIAFHSERLRKAIDCALAQSIALLHSFSDFVSNCYHLAIHTLHFLPPEAVHDVIVDHADGLHEGVADGGADEGEAALSQCFAHRV